MLPCIPAAFKIPACPTDAAVPAQWAVKTWDAGLSCVSSVPQATGLLLFCVEVTFSAGESNERCQRSGKAFLPY